MTRKRFYDQDPSVSQAVELLLIFPEEMQAVIADALSAIAEREFNANEMINDFKSLGSDKVLALYKSKQKKRKYDQNPTVHRAMNYMMILSSENRLFISRKILELITFMQDYLRTCKTHESSPTRGSVENIRDVYVQFGADDVRRFLGLMEEEFTRKLSTLQSEVSKEATRSSGPKEAVIIVTEEAALEGHGMKIKGDLL